MNIPLAISFVPMLPEPWNAAVIQTVFPMKSSAGAALKQALSRMLFRESRQSKPVFYANSNFMHVDGVWKHFTNNAVAWRPEQGIGVFPDDPPRLMTQEDFYSYELGKKMRSILDPVFSVKPADVAVASGVFELIAGYGNTTLIFSQMDSEVLGKQMTAGVLPLVVDETFRCFPLLVPFLNGRNVGYLESSPAVVSALEGVDLYFRECPEEDTVIIASREDLRAGFEEVGIVFDRVSKGWGIVAG